MSYYSVAEAAVHFPKPISPAAVLRKIRVGNKGVKLRAQFDGYTYVTTQEWIDQFILEVSETKKTLDKPILPPHKAMELFRAMRPCVKRNSQITENEE